MSDNVVHAVAGAGGGMISMALTYPLIMVSTRSQVSKTARVCQHEAFAKIIKEEGIRGLYSGIKSAMFGIAVTQYIYYYWYELVKAKLEGFGGSQHTLTIAENMLTGALAGAATATITNPIWVINTRMLINRDTMEDKVPAKQSGTLEAARKIFREEGVMGFFRGLFPALVLVINPVIQFTVYERLRIWWEKRIGRSLHAFDFFVLGALSKLCATSITYPYIVVKSRMQLKQGSDAASRYTSVGDGIRKIIRAEGVVGLYKGIESKLLQSVLSAAFTFAFKEELFQSAMSLLVLLGVRATKSVN
ncbi:hypothetical protein BASA50_005238 [Batrachochytrium salamandrivorans]|uniref:Mitochondrial carrier n=1 Tax=Batrachochytrium salamandrivorans TaxID=1357716 RepID=A0ABQ8FD36_9FUNG|nr:hypothetical protein BASA60_009693 [Batrachochytrium salamandrivorans]KAH6570195.1 hypothetical protein BASA62_004428 [Batrachochytrium salamandrivorans]KAH6593898.1 hypothetical protein BASA61_004117 [Batrachochytrium salamandrivorans]KAH6596198.1 hypothetical protein BASA50_005238 [Batrachochytrium salamandrivorans]KAH9272062.1 hypothetical protein BASA83_005649 [Batrachochytrium salamandrivorans]